MIETHRGAASRPGALSSVSRCRDQQMAVEGAWAVVALERNEGRQWVGLTSSIDALLMAVYGATPSPRCLGGEGQLSHRCSRRVGRPALAYDFAQIVRCDPWLTVRQTAERTMTRHDVVESAGPIEVGAVLAAVKDAARRRRGGLRPPHPLRAAHFRSLGQDGETARSGRTEKPLAAVAPLTAPQRSLDSVGRADGPRPKVARLESGSLGIKRLPLPE
jgi:hypothetical protein